MFDDKTDHYTQRFKRVLDYIDRHLDDALLLEALSEVAHFSPFHFHRQFSSYCGMPPGRYIQMMRLKRASYRLVFNPLESITDIAFDAGFQHTESFSRAFRHRFGLSPTQFRQQPTWIDWHQRLATTQRVRRYTLQSQVKIVHFPATPVAMLTHRGPSERTNETATRFVEWRKTSGLSPVGSSQTYGVAPDDPISTPTADFRFDICGSVVAPVDEDNPFGVVNAVIPAGRCAVVRHCGSHDALSDGARDLYGKWLPQSGEELRDYPLFFHYLNFAHEVAEHELVTDIYLPLK
ncbi:GyrI-like domain-containing protein [Lonsdalea britannica]|uniref:AraC family transcriptional regulator n=1 Tax=Lonsdalea britannica TaxID=1082704 RepID=UPI0026EA0EC6|nr:GyrI-like domain-containing protein [Lonsdalea britannica]